MRKNRSGVLAGLAVAACLLAAPAALAKTDFHSGIWALMRAAHYEFQANEDTRAWHEGTILAGGRQYEIWGYAWEESEKRPRPGRARHASYGVFVLERVGKKLTLLGAYPTDSVPFKVHDRTIKFEYPKGEYIGEGFPPSKKGDEIVFDDNGPPSTILLSGEFHKFDDAAHRTGIWRILRRAGFRDPTDIDAKASQIGSIAAGGKQYEIWRYSFEEFPRSTDPVLHERYRILVFERAKKGLAYSGSYITDNVPAHVEGQAIKLEFPAGTPPGNDQIVFDDQGPPAKVRLNQDERLFEH